MATAPVSQEPLGFPPKGSLRRVPFPRLIREVARHKVDGSLYLLSGQTKKVVFFEGGQPVFVRSNVLSECLGQILAQEGLITQEQCEQTLEAIRRTGKKQGELLVEMGILSEGNLRYGLEAQLRAKLFDIFSWEEGRYQFKSEAPDLQFGITLKSSAEGVIVEAIQDQYSEDRASEALDAVASKYPVLIEEAAATAELSLLPEERHFLACLDGSRTVRDLMKATPDPRVPTPQALLCGLLLAGLIKLADQAQPQVEWPPVPNLSPGGGTDEELRPSFEAQALITEYEDTPLPGELPQSPDLLGDHEDGFEGVGEDSGVVRMAAVLRATDLSEDLLAAEPDSIEETFDEDQIELGDDSEASGPALPPLLDVDAEPPPLLDHEPAFEELTRDERTPPDFDGDVPTAVEPPGPMIAGPAVPTPVAATGTMPTPPDELPAEPASMTPPPVVDPPPSLSSADLPGIPPPLLSSPSVPTVPSGPLRLSSRPEPATPTPPPVTPPSAASPPEANEEDLLDLAPDDDLLMVDENVEAQAMDLLGSNAPISVEPALSPDEAGLGELGGGEILETIDPVTLDPDSLEAAEPIEDSVVEVSPDELELDELDASEDEPNDDPLDFADLDEIDLNAESDEAPGLDDPDLDLSEDDLGGDVMGALRFNEGQSAVAEQRWAEAVSALEQAYEAGFDVAELHAMLAYARFQASGHDEHTAVHAFELLDYAQQMDPSLDLVYAYRAAIHKAQGDIPQAREAGDRALELNPYCELAMEIMDSLG
ncbi:MAG: DUF4388 domain-containing protein [Myxococcota bacterium]